MSESDLTERLRRAIERQLAGLERVNFGAVQAATLAAVEETAPILFTVTITADEEKAP